MKNLADDNTKQEFEKRILFPCVLKVFKKTDDIEKKYTDFKHKIANYLNQYPNDPDVQAIVADLNNLIEEKVFEQRNKYLNKHKVKIDKHLESLQYRCASLYTELLNLITSLLVFLGQSIFPCLKGQFEKNKTETGSHSAFFRSGPKRSADLLLHEAMTLPVRA